MKRKYYMLIILFVVGIAIGSFVILNNKKLEYKELPRVKLKKQNKPKQFALLLEQTKGKGDYKESKSNDLPLGGYKFNEEKSGCTDVNGKKVEDVLSYDYDTYTVILDTSKTLYCYLYYDKDNVINYLRSTDTEKHLSQELVGGMYRYQGLYTDDVRNYICLGEYCCNTESCSEDDNDSMYRIIGVTEDGELKVIKKTSLTNLLWWSHSKTTDIKWPQSLIYQKLNGKSDNSTEPNLTDSNSYYYNLSENIKNLIVTDHTWLYGNTSSYGNYNGNTMYDIESGSIETTFYNKEDSDGNPTGKGEWYEKIEAPIGLMYLHDYLYAYKTNEEDSGNPANQENAKKGWINISNNQNSTTLNEWLISGYGYLFRLEDYSAWYIDRTTGGLYQMLLWYQALARPVFYLTSDIELSGIGTKENPFMIN